MLRLYQTLNRSWQSYPISYQYELLTAFAFERYLEDGTSVIFQIKKKKKVSKNFFPDCNCILSINIKWQQTLVA